jgi:hypothetical protein
MKFKIFLDSGAFSAFMNKATVSLQNYIDYILENEQYIETYACLDDIGSPEKTWENQREMERQGLSPLPVYHMGEPEEFFQRVLEYPHFAVGGIASSVKGSGSLQNHLDILFSRICTEKTDYYPSHKVHGFGIAIPQLIARYPFYSIDTSSWVAYGKYGIILVPRKVHGKLRFDVSPYTVTVSTRSKAVGEAKHFQHLPKIEQDWIIEYCGNHGMQMGISTFTKCPLGQKLEKNQHRVSKGSEDVEVVLEKGLINDHESRDRMNLIFFLEMEKHQPKWPWRWYQQKKEGLF